MTCSGLFNRHPFAFRANEVVFAQVTEGLIFVPPDQDAPALLSEVCLNTFSSSIVVMIPCLLDRLPLPEWLCEWKQVCWSHSRATPAAPLLCDWHIHWYLALLLLPLCQIVAFCWTWRSSCFEQFYSHHIISWCPCPPPPSPVSPAG